MQPDPDLFFAPCSRDNNESAIRYLRETVLNGISPDEYPEIRDLGYTDRTPVWGVVESKKSTWEQMTEGVDVVLFYSKSGVYTHLAIVDTKHVSAGLASKIWDPYEGSGVTTDPSDPWSHIYFLRDVTEVNIPAAAVHDALGYEMEFPLGFMRPTDDRLASCRAEYGSIATFLSTVATDGSLTVESILGSAPPEDIIETATGERDADAEQGQRELPEGSETTARRTATRDDIVRNQTLVTNLKALYDDTCQICGDRRLQDPDVGFSHVHHLMPLGNPHDGDDKPKNMIVVCPNHHEDFEHGLIKVDPQTREMQHLYEDKLSGETIETRGDHEIGPQYLAYHNEVIASDQI